MILIKNVSSIKITRIIQCHPELTLKAKPFQGLKLERFAQYLKIY